MANYYYVKNGGTATGDAGRVATTKSTGTFTAKGASAYYDSIADALGATTPPASGDFIMESHLHDLNYATDVTLAIPDGVTILSVDDTALNTYLRGAKESATGGIYDITLKNGAGLVSHIKGVSFEAQDNIAFANTGGHLSITDCELGFTADSAADVMSFSQDGNSTEFIDVDLDFKADGQDISVVGGGKLVINGGTLQSPLTKLFATSGNGGGEVTISNYDFSIMTSGYLFLLTSITSDVFTVKLNRCKKADAVSLTSGNTVAYPGQQVDAWSIDNGDGYHYFEHIRYEGRVLESTTVKRTGGATYDGTNGFSAEFQPNYNVIAYTQPLRIKIAELELDLTSANTLTFHLAFGDDSFAITPFNNDEAWIEIEQNSDALTSKALGITINTKPDDILTTPTQLTASTEEFTSNATTLELDYVYSDKRQIAIDTVAVSGMTNGQVTAYLCIAKYDSNDTLQIFACPSPVVK